MNSVVSIDDMSPLDDRLDRIVDHYVKTLNELAKLPPLGEEWSDLDRQASEGEVEFTTKSANENDIFQRIHDRCSEFIESGASQKLADQCTIFWEEFWSLLINKVTEAGSLPDNNISSWKPGVEDDSLLVRIKNNKSDAEAYLELAPCISDVKDSIHDIPPFSEINWRDLRNDFEHHNWEKNWKNDNHLITFYSEPGYLRWEWSDYRDAVEKCLRVVSGDFSKSKSSLLTRRAKKSSELSAKARYSSDMLKAQIEALEWSPADYYINPQDSGDQVQELANLLHSQSIVQLVGTGGLGKTALAYKFILENLSGGMEFTDRSPHEPISPFFPVIFLTSKDWPQGEFDATHYRDLDLSELEDDDPDNPRNPHNPKIGAGEFYSGDFDSFTHNVSTLNDSSWGKSPKDTAYQVIAQQNVLVVLDNFEDVLEGQGQSENEELKKYLAFFNQFTNPRGRIILTTRELVEGMRGTPLELLPVSNRARFELMKNRFLFLSVEHGLPAHPKTALFFTEGTTEQRTKAFNSLAEEIGENFRENLRYPHVIFMFTRELMEAVNSRSISLRPGWTFEDAVRAVATREDEDGYSFAKLVERHWEWSILKSFNSVKNSELCLDILKLLWERNRGMSMQDIIGQIGRPIGEIRESINRLMIHGVFLDKNTSDSKAGPAKILETDSFKLKAGARGTLGKLREFKGLLTRSNPEPISNAQRSDLDIIKQLQTEIEAPTGPANKSRIAELLGKLVNPPRGVSISGRRPINENVVRRAFEVLQDIDSKYPEEGGG